MSLASRIINSILPVTKDNLAHTDNTCPSRRNGDPDAAAKDVHGSDYMETAAVEEEEMEARPPYTYVRPCSLQPLHRD